MALLSPMRLEPRSDPADPLPANYSSEREPWRLLRSSMTVRFSWWRRRNWSPDQLTQSAKEEIRSALETRGSILRSYSDLHSALFDLVCKARTLPTYAQFDDFGTWTNIEVVRSVRSLVEADGPLSPARVPLNEIIERIEAASEALDLIVHGFVDVTEKKCGQFLFTFTLWGKRQSLTHAQLRSEAAGMERLSNEARRRLAAATSAL